MPSSARLRFGAATALARVEAGVGRLTEAATVLATARALFDPAWPPDAALDLADAEGIVATAEGNHAGNLYWTRQTVIACVASGRKVSAALTNLADAELATGDAAAAAATCRRALELLSSGRDEYELAMVRLNLGAALLALDQPGAAAEHLRAGWAMAPQFDVHVFFADHLALLAALESRFDSAARIAGYADTVNAQVGERQPNEAAAIARATQLARAALGDAEFNRLHAEGTLLRDADIAALAFGPQPPA